MPSYLGTKGPASIRYNNPGSQYPGPSARRYGFLRTEVIGGGHKIAVFDDAIKGAAAMFDLLLNGKNSTIGVLYCGKSIRDAITVWSGKNHVDAYLAIIRRETIFDDETVLDADFIKDSTRAIPFAKAMALHEAGKEYPLNDREWEQAHDLFMQAQAKPIEQRTTLDKSSRKMRLLKVIRYIFGGGLLAPVTYSLLDWLELATEMIGKIGTFVTEFGVPILIVTTLAGFVINELVQVFLKEDYEDGRYTPSGEKESENHNALPISPN